MNMPCYPNAGKAIGRRKNILKWDTRNIDLGISFEGADEGVYIKASREEIHFVRKCICYLRLSIGTS